MKRILFSLFVYFGVTASICVGQTPPDIIPPSPVSREFAKFVSHEVSLYNGVPEIEIPLYEIKLKGLTIPLTLSYHASGIKFGQIDGDVGVGWSLSSAYRISRTIHGYADEMQPMPADMISTISYLEWNGDKAARDGFLSKFVPEVHPNVSLDFGMQYNGRHDGEFDQFVFSMPTAGGNFIITDRDNKIATTIEMSNLKIDYRTKTGSSQCAQLGINSIVGVQIIDETGVMYTFGEYNSQTECNIETASPIYGGHVATAWPLSEIVTPLGEGVTFRYEQRESWDKFTDQKRYYTVRETAEANCFVGTSAPSEGGDISHGLGYATFYSKEILAPNEKIVFNYNGPAPAALFPRKLNNIQVRDGAGNILRTVEFFYSSSNIHIFLDSVSVYDATHSEAETYRFDYYSKNLNGPFSADQNGYYLLASSPPQYYHQEFLDDPILVNTVTEVSHPSGSSTLVCSHDYGRTMQHFMPGMGISREPVATPQYFSLTKIIYPTGGSTEFEYEHGRYGSVSESKNSGIRIKKIRSNDLNSPDAIVRQFKYGNNYNGQTENGMGNAEAWITPNLFVSERGEVLYHCDYFEHSFRCDFYNRRVITYSTVIQGDIGAALSQGSFIRYPVVTEYYSDGATGGKTVYYFETGDQFHDQGYPYRTLVPRETYAGYHTYIDRYSLWDKPRLKRQVSYAFENGQHVPKAETIYSYSTTSDSYTGLKVVQSVIRDDQSIITNNNFIVDRYFNYGTYVIETGKNALSQKEERLYAAGDTITTKYTYTYIDHLITKEAVTRSSGDNVITYTSYPSHYGPGTAFIDHMTQKNLLAYPVERVSVIDDGTNQKIVSGHVIRYRTGGEGMRDSEHWIEVSSPIGLSSFKFSNRQTGVLPPLGSATAFAPDIRYKPRLSYSYDDHGNVQRVTQDGSFVTSYIWGYNHTYPIAKVVNAVYDPSGFYAGTWSRVNQVLYENFEEHPQRISSSGAHTGKYVFKGTFNVELRDKLVGNYLLTYWSSTNGTTWTRHDVPITVTGASTIHSIGGASIFLDDIRLHPVDAQMATYTYDPLIGMTSQTDPAGLQVYYEYDAFGRLINTKDSNRNVVQQFKYKYKD